METIGKILVAFGVVILVACLFSLPTMLLWNWVVPDIFGLKEIDFWQALGLTLLCSILFKNSTSSND